jgi:uncharacterized lipoprotein YajG
MHIYTTAGLASFALLTACSAAQTTQATTAAATLATVAAADNSTVAALVTKGQLFCQKASGVVAVVKDLATPTSVIGIASDVVAAACAGLGAVPVPMPVDIPLAGVPAAVVPGALG